MQGGVKMTLTPTPTRFAANKGSDEGLAGAATLAALGRPLCADRRADGTQKEYVGITKLINQEVEFTGLTQNS